MSRLTSILVLLSPLTAQNAGQLPDAVPGEHAPRLAMRGRGLGAGQVLFDAPGDGSIWASTSTYKAAFDSDGLEFVPFLGSSAPRDFPVQFTLESARLGDGRIPLAAVRAPERRGNSVLIDHGSLIERYEVGAEGVEQTFVFGAPPKGSGDLVLRVRVATDLLPDQSGGGLSFRSDLGSVGYGAARLRDAAGRSTPVAERFDDGCIELRVPAAALADAVYPLAIDPLIAAFPVTSQTIVEHQPDIAYDAVSQRYFVVWEQGFSATDQDVYSLQFDVTGAPVAGSLQAIDNTTLNWTRPRCAITSGYVLTVASRGVAGRRQVWGRQLYVPQPGVIGSQFLIAVNQINAYEVYNPDVGGATPMIGGGRWLVAYEKSQFNVGRSIVGQLVQNGALNGASFVIDPFGDAHNPAVARSTGDQPVNDAGWPVVWQRYDIVHNDDDIWGAVVSPAGAFQLTTFPIDTSARNDTNPSVSSITDPIAGGQRLFLVAWEGEMGPADHDIFVRAMSVSGTLSIGPIDVSALDAGSRGRDQVLPHLDSDGCRFALAHAEALDPVNLDVCAWTLGIVNGQSLSVSEGKVSLASTSLPETGPRVFANHSAEPYDSRALYGVVWEQAGDIVAAEYGGFASGGYSLRLTGCGQLGMTHGLRPVIGGSVSAALQNAGGDLCAMIVGNPSPGLPLPCAPCQLGVDMNSAVSLLTRAIGIAVPTDSRFVGTMLSIQGAALGTGYPCYGGQVRFSDTLDVTIQ